MSEINGLGTGVKNQVDVRECTESVNGKNRLNMGEDKGGI